MRSFLPLTVAHRKRRSTFQTSLPTFPYSLSGKGSLTLHPSRLSFAIFLALCPLAMTTVTLALGNPVISRNGMAMVTYSIQAITLSFYFPLILVTAFLFRRPLARAIAGLARAERLLASAGVRPSGNGRAGRTILPIQVFSLLLGTMVHSNWLRRTKHLTVWTMVLSLHGPLAMMFVTADAFSHSLNMLSKINDRLTSSFSQSAGRLQVLCRVHDSISEAVSNIRVYYEWAVLFLILESFIIINFNVFLAMTISKQQIIFAFWASMFSWPVIRMCLIASTYTTKADAFYDKLLAALKEGRHSINNVQLYSHLSKKKRENFLLCGILKLDGKLLGSLITASASYSLFLLEMGTKFDL